MKINKYVEKLIQVVLLPAERKESYSHIYTTLKGEKVDVMNLNQIIKNIETNKLILNQNSAWAISCDTDVLVPHHLYVLSDDKIKEGDWFLTDVRDRKSDNNGIPIWELRQCSKITNEWIFVKGEDGIGYNPDWSKKIIATNDGYLNTERIHKGEIIDESYPKYFGKLPEPNQLFIEDFIAKYNDGNPISEWLVDYEWEARNVSLPQLTDGIKRNKQELLDMGVSPSLGDIIYSLKVNPEDNTITINPIKYSYNTQHLYKLARWMKHTDFNIHGYSPEDCVNKWLEEENVHK